MSTSVYSSARPLLTSNNQEIKRFILPKEQKVSRRLFGPVDPQATKKFIDEEMKKMIVIKSELWNFDFKQERNLDPNGLYDWRPVTPKKQIRPIKRRNGSDLDNSDQYCHIPEFEVIKPRPVRFGSSPSSVRNAQQSRITDYMKAIKRPAPSADISKKQPSSEWNSDIPHKIPRLDLAS